ncbi:17323_t:CDS:1, partial [Funneliformis caledonium]
QYMCNGTISVIDINLLSMEVRVAFSIIGGIVDIGIKKESATFIIDSKSLSRYQFPLQNVFALIVHKTLGLTFSLSLDQQLVKPMLH